MNLSAVIISKNAEATIARTLRSAAFADEQIVVVDDASHDRTAVVAKQFGASVYTMPWRGYGPQKNFGLAKARGDWVLFIDDDEEITPALAGEIKEIIKRQPRVANRNFYWLRITTVFLGHPLRHLYGHNLRLFRKGAGQWTDAKVHEQVQLNSGRLVRLGDNQSAVVTTSLLHHSHQTVGSYLVKMHRYTTLDAEQMYRTGQHRSEKRVTPTFHLPYYLAGKQLLKLLLYRRGILDGYAGITWCVLSAYYEWELGQKYKSKVKSQKSKL
jgi:hypothetical protein